MRLWNSPGRFLRLALAGVGLAVLATSARAQEPTPTPEVKLIPVEGPMVGQANRTLQLAGLPTLPTMAVEYNCYAWSGLSAGIYASFKLKKDEFNGWLAGLPGDLQKTSPVPTALLSPPNSEAPWFSPAMTGESYVLARGRISRAAPEIFRVYVDPENLRILFYYSWNNKRTYP